MVGNETSMLPWIRVQVCERVRSGGGGGERAIGCRSNIRGRCSQLSRVLAPLGITAGADTGTGSTYCR